MIGPDFGARRSTPATSTVKTWVRHHLGPNDDATVMVAELACREPGCPPTETVISILEPGATRSVHFHKPINEITEPDIAAAFAKPLTEPQVGQPPPSS